jgi:hypothetical protein
VIGLGHGFAPASRFRKAASPGIKRTLCMALMTGILGGRPMDMLCSAGHGSLLTGMVPMYMLMSAFHLAPWLKLISRR